MSHLIHCTCLALLFLICAPSHGQIEYHTPTEVPGIRHAGVLKGLWQDVYSEAYLSGTIDLSWTTPDGEVLQMSLMKSDILSDNYRLTSSQEEASGDLALPLRGWTKDGGKVRLTFAPNFIYGFVEAHGATWWFEPYWFHHEGQIDDRTIIYREQDAIPEYGGTCAAHATPSDLGELVERLEKRSVGLCYEAELAIASDYSMYTKYGSNVNNVQNRNIAVINTVNEAYEGNFNDEIVFEIVEQVVINCSGCDPWTSSTDPGDLLNDFGSWGNNGGFSNNFDVGELWSARNFDGTTIGLAWVSGMCTNFRYHVLEDYTSNGALRKVLTSHEIGHNLSADHAPASDYIMSPTISVTDDWHSNSVTSISSFIHSRRFPLGCLDQCPQTTPPSAAFDVLETDLCEGSLTAFFDRSTDNPSSWIWTMPGAIPSSSTSANPVVSYALPGFYTVSLTVTNAGGSDTETKSNLISVGTHATDIMFYEDFSGGLSSWQLVNPDNNLTWQVRNVPRTMTGTNPVCVRNYNYTTTGQRDGMISPSFSLAGRTDALLYIGYAYATRPGAPTDSLIVYGTKDGGATYQRLAAFGEAGSGNFATHAPSSSLFEPSAVEDWCVLNGNCLEIDLSPFIGETNVQVKIENYNNRGNNLYVDFVAVKADCYNLVPPSAAFDADVTEGCAPLQVQYEDLSTGAPTSWLWIMDGADPTTSMDQNPSVVYHAAGDFSTQLHVMNAAGTDQLELNNYIHVLDIPQVNFDYFVNGLEVNFINRTPGNGNTYLWDFGDGDISSDASPSHTYGSSGVYQVNLIVENMCGSSNLPALLMLGEAPVADFSWTETDSCEGAEVMFSDLSTGDDLIYAWQFMGGIPATSAEPNPVVRYPTAGSYDVSLTVSNALGSDLKTYAQIIEIGAAPQADFDLGYNGYRTIRPIYTGSAYDSIQWYFGDGSSSNLPSPTHSYDQDSLLNGYDITLIVYNSCGADTAMEGLYMTELPFDVTYPDLNNACIGVNLDFSAQTFDQVYWTFEGATPNSSDQAQVSVVYYNGGQYSVELIAIGDMDTFYYESQVTVHETPLADFIIEDSVLIDQSVLADGIEWYVDGVFVSTDEVYTLDSFGEYIITLVAENLCGRDTFTMITNWSSVANRTISTSDAMRLFPNPSDGSFTLTFDAPQTNVLMKMFDMSAHLVHSVSTESTDAINITIDVPDGIYWIEVMSDQGRYIKRLAVQQ